MVPKEASSAERVLALEKIPQEFLRFTFLAFSFAAGRLTPGAHRARGEAAKCFAA